jgi:hypothetical protein
MIHTCGLHSIVKHCIRFGLIYNSTQSKLLPNTLDMHLDCDCSFDLIIGKPPTFKFHVSRLKKQKNTLT